MFKKASQMKLRFDTAKGQLTVEDLFDLPLTSESNVSLDGIAIAVSRELQDSQENSFVESKSKGSDILELRLEILKDVIAARIAENEARRDEEAKKTRNDRIMQIIADKQDDALANKTIDELKELLAA